MKANLVYHRISLTPITLFRFISFHFVLRLHRIAGTGGFAKSVSCLKLSVPSASTKEQL
jgi:hypothetical protein